MVENLGYVSFQVHTVLLYVAELRSLGFWHLRLTMKPSLADTDGMQYSAPTLQVPRCFSRKCLLPNTQKKRNSILICANAIMII